MSVIDSELGLISVILGSSVVAAFITSFFIKLGEDKKIRIENITQERKEWRDRIRELTVELTHAFDTRDRAAIRKIESELIVRLNPEDSEDLKIIQAFPNLYNLWDEELLRRMCDDLAYLLKHDWERAKKEVSGGPTLYGLLFATVFATVSAFLLLCIFSFFIKDEVFSLGCHIFFVSLWFIVSLFLYFIFKLCAHHSRGAVFWDARRIKVTLGLVRRLSFRSRADRQNNKIEVFCTCEIILLFIIVFLFLSGFFVC